MRLYVNKEHLTKDIEYPARYQSENLLKSEGIVFATLLVFLLLFMPFGVYDPELKMPYFFICLFHALSPAFLILVYFSGFNYIRKRKRTAESWTLLKEYSQIAVILLLAGLSSFFMRDLIYNNAGNWSWHYLWEEIRNCFVAGIFFYFFVRLSSFYFESKKGSPLVLQFVQLDVESKVADAAPPLYVSTQVRQDDFILDTDQLLFVKADGNYIELTKSDGIEVKVNNQSQRLKSINLYDWNKIGYKIESDKRKVLVTK